ncbi:MAG: hypothetical protein NTY29_09355, partial [Proteobacteria bacterium]|nr:hypothetical protein [Pseudomonadota bacterium]
MKIQKLIIVFILSVFTCFSFSVYEAAAKAEPSHPPMPEALEAMESDISVTVETVEVAEWAEGSNYYYVFKPKYTNPNIGFIFYPGGLVDPRAYAPPARAIAAKGYLTVIVKMVGDLAVLSSNRA